VLETKYAEGKEIEMTNRGPLEAKAPVRKAGSGVATNLASSGFGANGKSGISPELRETEQQLRSGDLWRQMGETEGWAISERVPSGGQQLWREGEGSGL